MSECDSSSSTSLCFMCHQITHNPNQIPLCNDCAQKIQINGNYQSSPFDKRLKFNKNDFDSIIPNRSIEEMEAAISETEFHPSSNIAKQTHNQIKRYYHDVGEWINVINELNQPPDYDSEIEDKNEANFCIRCATYCSFGLNFMLLIGKALAMSTSASYTIMSSLADSCLDIIAGIIISCTAANSKTTENDKQNYPVGKSRISTIGILVFSVLMSCCAVFIILQCVHSLLAHENAPPTTGTAVFIMIMTICVKFCMWFVYNWLDHPITITLAEDHRNDVFTNSFGLFMYYGGCHFYWWMDSLGGLLLSLFVLNSWAKNALENAKALIGVISPPEIIRNLTYVAAHHHPLIKSVSSVVAYQIGPNYFADVHIIVNNDVSTEAALWVADSLQKRLERVDDIEHAYVHLETLNHDNKLTEMLEDFNVQQEKKYKLESLNHLCDI